MIVWSKNESNPFIIECYRWTLLYRKTYSVCLCTTLKLENESFGWLMLFANNSLLIHQSCENINIEINNSKNQPAKEHAGKYDNDGRGFGMATAWPPTARHYRG